MNSFIKINASVTDRFCVLIIINGSLLLNFSRQIITYNLSLLTAFEQ